MSGLGSSQDSPLTLLGNARFGKAPSGAALPVRKPRLRGYGLAIQIMLRENLTLGLMYHPSLRSIELLAGGNWERQAPRGPLATLSWG